ncbi:MAG: hypothetical protein WD895_03725 [Acidimicrobiia bacterium]
MVVGLGQPEVVEMARLALAAATAMTLGFPSDAFWIQGASLLAMCLALVFILERKGRRNTAVLLLGVLVAWRPWLAPMPSSFPAAIRV